MPFSGFGKRKFSACGCSDFHPNCPSKLRVSHWLFWFKIPPNSSLGNAGNNTHSELCSGGFFSSWITLFSCLQDFASRAKVAVQNLVQKVGFFGILACASVSFPQEQGDLFYLFIYLFIFFVCSFCDAQGNKICWNCVMISSGVDVLYLTFWTSSDPEVWMDWRVENYLQGS